MSSNAFVGLGLFHSAKAQLALVFSYAAQQLSMFIMNLKTTNPIVVDPPTHLTSGLAIARRRKRRQPPVLAWVSILLREHQRSGS